MVEGKCTDSDAVEETYYSGNIGQWMGGSMEEITGGLARSSYMETISCEMLYGRLIVITDGTAKEEEDEDVQQDDMQHNT